MQGICDRHGAVTVVCPRCAGAEGGKVGGKSRSPRRLDACRENARRGREALRRKRAALEGRPAPLPRVYEKNDERETRASPPRAAPPGNRIRQEFEAAIEASRLAMESWTKRR